MLARGTPARLYVGARSARRDPAALGPRRCGNELLCVKSALAKLNTWQARRQMDRVRRQRGNTHRTFSVYPHSRYAVPFANTSSMVDPQLEFGITTQNAITRVSKTD